MVSSCITCPIISIKIFSIIFALLLQSSLHYGHKATPEISRDSALLMLSSALGGIFCHHEGWSTGHPMPRACVDPNMSPENLAQPLPHFPVEGLSFRYCNFPFPANLGSERTNFQKRTSKSFLTFIRLCDPGEATSARLPDVQVEVARCIKQSCHPTCHQNVYDTSTVQRSD